MAVKIRLKRVGGKHEPHYRIVAAERLSKRDGKELEILGSYNPRQVEEKDKVRLKTDRVSYWLQQGAKPTQTVAVLLRKAGMLKKPAAEASN
ncbi:MAG: 30S ribosomal protein S16 [Candidatus Alcyoniella australis]|nr:30S ribosomal protein S16 [Candidatus Alcyoniella australis]